MNDLWEPGGQYQQIEFPDETEILGTLENYAKLKELHNGNEKSDPLAPVYLLMNLVEENGTLVWLEA